MTAAQDTYELMRDLETHGPTVSFEDANTLRRAQLTLHRWAEAKCGDSGEYAAVSIERDETTGIPYRCVYWHDRNGVERTRIPDREAGALRRVAAICERIGAHYYHQTDPRGSALRISREPMTASDYTRGVAV